METIPNITGVYLAAGHSIRMGEDKRYLPWRDRPLASWALHEANASKLDSIVLVGRHDDTFGWLGSDLPSGSDLHLVRTRSDSINLSHSLQTGLRKAVSLQAAAVVILLADQPFVTRTHINALIEEYQACQPHPPAFICSSYERTYQPPILLHHTLFDEVFQLEGDQGARGIILKRKQSGTLISFSDSLWPLDVDTPDTYSLLLSY